MTMERCERIERKLGEVLQAEYVEVMDEGHLHVGHAGARSGGGHFRVAVVSKRFEGLSRLQAQRLVYAALAEEMGGEIHALSMTTLTPDQWAARD